MTELVECIKCGDLLSRDIQDIHKETRHLGDESVTFKDYNVMDSHAALQDTSHAALQDTSPAESEMVISNILAIKLQETVLEHVPGVANVEPRSDVTGVDPPAHAEVKVEDIEEKAQLEEMSNNMTKEDEQPSTSELNIKKEEECGAEEEKAEDHEDDLSLPAIKRRPTRIIKPVTDKANAVKFVESDVSTDDDDGEWEKGTEVLNERDTQSSNNDTSSVSSEGDSCDDDSDDEGDTNISSIVHTDPEEQEEDQSKQRIQITEEDMPFLFEKRAPGKRQIKLVEFSNELVEKAAAMSSGSSSDDEDWRAKQADITEQLHQEDDEEVIDMDDVPIAEDNSQTAQDKPQSIVQKPKSKLSQEQALQLSLCCVCLMGVEEDNVMECDNCGVTIHEGCYGYPATDPDDMSDEDLCWFCEPCIANVEPCCELCPDRNGVMKRTDTGKFCHMVCALYTSGIAFEDTTLLEPIITTDVPPSKWGSKKCDLCEDVRFAYTGLVVECEAGLCKSYFHITCAQKFGYLMETTSTDLKVDPFFAYCKIHVDKDIARAKRKLYLNLLDHFTAYKSLERPEVILQQLEINRRAYTEKRKSVEVPAIMTEKHPRALFGSPSAFAKLIRKAEMFGLDTNIVIVDDAVDMTGAKKNVKPAISSEFSNQYMARQSHIKTARQRYDQLSLQIFSLKEEEHELQNRIPQLDKEIRQITTEFDKVRKQALNIWNFIAEINKKQKVPKCLLTSKKRHIGIKSIVPPSLLKNCKICSSHQNKEMMVDCDGCGNYFHFRCLTPPVTRSPKVSKRWAWYCQNCNQQKDDEIHKPAAELKIESGPASKFGRSIKKPDVYSGTTKYGSSSSESSSSDSDSSDSSDSTEESPKKRLKDQGNPRIRAVVEFEELICRKCKKSDTDKMCICCKCNAAYHKECVGRLRIKSDFMCIRCIANKPVISHYDKKRLKDELSDTDIVEPTSKKPNTMNSQSVPSGANDNVTETKKHRNIFDLKFHDKTLSPVKASKHSSEEPPPVMPDVKIHNTDYDATDHSIFVDDTESNVQIESVQLASENIEVPNEVKIDDTADAEGIVLYIKAKSSEEGNSYSVSNCGSDLMIRETVNEEDGGVSIEISAEIIQSGQEILIKQSTIEAEVKIDKDLLEEEETIEVIPSTGPTDLTKVPEEETLPASEEPPASEEHLDSKELPVSERPPASEEFSASEETPVSEEPPVSERPPASEKPPASEEPPASEAFSVSERPPASEEFSASEETTVSEEPPASEEPSALEELSKLNPTATKNKDTTNLLVSYAASSDEGSEDMPVLDCHNYLAPVLEHSLNVAKPSMSTIEVRPVGKVMDFTQDRANFTDVVESSKSDPATAQIEHVLNESFGEKSIAVNALLAMSETNVTLNETKKMLAEMNEVRQTEMTESTLELSTEDSSKQNTEYSSPSIVLVNKAPKSESPPREAPATNPPPPPPPIFVPLPAPIITNYNPETTPRVLPRDFYESLCNERYSDIPSYSDAEDI